MKSVLSEKLLQITWVAVEGLSFDAPKTKEFKQVLANLTIDSKVLVVLETENDFAALSARNLPSVSVVTADNVSVLDVVSADKMLVTQTAPYSDRGGACIMNLLDVIKRPVITEKSMLAMDDKKYTFEVDTKANKTLVKQAVEAAFDGVKVANVNIINVRP